MIGARDYANLFTSGQYGKLYIESGSHARGRTFHIWVLPSKEKIDGRPHEGVEVYGVVSGHPGWTEMYGWLHRGKWEQDFECLVAARRAEAVAKKARLEQAKMVAAESERLRVERLLENY